MMNKKQKKRNMFDVQDDNLKKKIYGNIILLKRINFDL